MKRHLGILNGALTAVLLLSPVAIFASPAPSNLGIVTIDSDAHGTQAIADSQFSACTTGAFVHGFNLVDSVGTFTVADATGSSVEAGAWHGGRAATGNGFDTTLGPFALTAGSYVAHVTDVSGLSDKESNQHFTVSDCSAGNKNKGDVWVDTVGALPGPGHEMDPHLPCADINLWGAGLADASGTFTIDGWPPSGSQQQAYPKTGTLPWSYSGAKGATQNLLSGAGDPYSSDSDIDVNVLIANARANGDAPVNKQGYHFKLQFSQDPQKHKTFWVNCAATTPVVTPPPPCASSAVDRGLGNSEKDEAKADRDRADAEKLRSDSDAARAADDRTRSDSEQAAGKTTEAAGDKARADAEQHRADAEKAESDADRAKAADKDKEGDADLKKADAEDGEGPGCNPCTVTAGDKDKGDALKDEAKRDRDKAAAEVKLADADHAEAKTDRDNADRESASGSAHEADLDKARADAEDKAGDAEQKASDTDREKADAEDKAGDAEHAASDIEGAHEGRDDQSCPVVPPVPTPSPSPSGNPGGEPSPSSNPGGEPSPSSNPGGEPSPSSNPGGEPSPSSNPGGEPSPSGSPSVAPSPTANPGPTCPRGYAMVSNYSYLIDGTRSAGQLENNVQPGDVVQANFTIASGCKGVQVSLVSYEAPSALFSRSTADQQVLFDSQTGTFDAGRHSLTVHVPSCFFQVDFVLGAPLVHLGPASSNNFYADQHRLIDFENGGTTSCSAPQPKPDLHIVKTVSPSTSPVPANSVLTYTIDVSNTGDAAASNVAVQEQISSTAPYTVLANSFTLSPAASTVTKQAAGSYLWEIPTVAAGQHADLTFSVKVTGAGRIDNTAAIVGGPSSTVTTSVTPVAENETGTLVVTIDKLGTSTTVPGGAVSLIGGAAKTSYPATFGDLTPATYCAAATAPGGWTMVGSNSQCATVQAGQTTTVVFLVTQNPETACVPVVIELAGTSLVVPGGTVDVAGSPATGTYPASFCGLTPGTVTATATAPSGFVLVTPSPQTATVAAGQNPPIVFFVQPVAPGGSCGEVLAEIVLSGTQTIIPGGTVTSGGETHTTYPLPLFPCTQPGLWASARRLRRATSSPGRPVSARPWSPAR